MLPFLLDIDNLIAYLHFFCSSHLIFDIPGDDRDPTDYESTNQAAMTHIMHYPMDARERGEVDIERDSCDIFVIFS